MANNNVNQWESDRVGAARDILSVLPKSNWILAWVRGKVIWLIQDHPSPSRITEQALWVAIQKPIDTPHSHSIESVTTMNSNLRDLQTIRWMILSNPVATLKMISDNIWELLTSEWVTAEGVSMIEDSVKDCNSENFDSILNSINSTLWHTSVIFFLEHCIHESKELTKVREYLEFKIANFSEWSRNKMEYWDYTNTINLLAFKEQIQNNQLHDAKSVSISWWAGNMFAAFGTISEYLNSDKKIDSLSGSSMGSVISVMVSLANNDKKKLNDIMMDIEQWFELNSSRYVLSWLVSWDNIPKLKVFITALLNKYGIDENTRFSDLPIPVIINASRIYEWGEQEVFLWWTDTIISSIFASMNIPTKWKLPLLWSTPVRWVELRDHSTNIKWNPVSPLRSIWTPDESIMALDGGYSSDRLFTIMSLISRIWYPDALMRDHLMKSIVMAWWGTVIDYNSPWVRSAFGYRFSEKLTRNAFLEWRRAFNRIFQEK